jgi:hypothetical protein
VGVAMARGIKQRRESFLVRAHIPQRDPIGTRILLRANSYDTKHMWKKYQSAHDRISGMNQQMQIAKSFSFIMNASQIQASAHRKRK